MNKMDRNMKTESTKAKKKKSPFDIANYCVCFLILLIVLYPLYFVVIASFSDPNYVNTGQVIFWPKGFNLDGYRRVMKTEEIWSGFKNSVIYTVFGTILNVAMTLTSAYALSKKRLVGRGFFQFMIVFTMFFGGGMIPTYLLMKNLNLLNTPWIMIIPGAVSAYNLIVTKTFFINSIPDELEEAARIDGASDFRIFFKIVMPLSTPIIAVITLFYGIGHWNSYFDGMIYLSDRELLPLQVILKEILTSTQTAANQSGALSTEQLKLAAEQQKIAEMVKYVSMIVATVPVLIVYPFIQKYFKKGVMVGSLKG